MTLDAEGRGFTFNADNKRIKVVENGQTVGEYFYDGEGKQVKKQTYDASGLPKGTTVFVYSSGKLIAEYSTQVASQGHTNYTQRQKRRGYFAGRPENGG